MNFKGRAKNWDSEAMIKRSMVIADKISELIGTQKQISILDYGCATGLIGFELSDKYQKLI